MHEQRLNNVLFIMSSSSHSCNSSQLLIISAGSVPSLYINTLQQTHICGHTHIISHSSPCSKNTGIFRPQTRLHTGTCLFALQYSHQADSVSITSFIADPHAHTLTHTHIHILCDLQWSESDGESRPLLVGKTSTAGITQGGKTSITHTRVHTLTNSQSVS